MKTKIHDYTNKELREIVLNEGKRDIVNEASLEIIKRNSCLKGLHAVKNWCNDAELSEKAELLLCNKNKERLKKAVKSMKLIVYSTAIVMTGIALSFYFTGKFDKPCIDEIGTFTLDINNENNISIKKGDTIQVFGQDVIVYNYSENTGEVTYIVLDTVKFNEALKKYKNKPKTRVILP